MIKKILKIGAILFIILLGISFYLSPRLFGLLTFGKDAIDKSVSTITFDSTATHQHKLIYSDNTHRADFKELRTTYQLDSIIKDSPTDFDKVTKIQSWIQTRWRHDGDNIPEYNDALYILKDASKGRQFRCVEYSIVAGQCLVALGFKARGLGLMAKDISDVKWGGGHVVNEVYMNDINKWIMLDPQYDVFTTYKGVPLNAVELQYCIAHDLDFELINPNKTITKEEYKKWIGPYLYYFTTTIKGEKISIWDRIVGNKKQLTLYPIEAEIPRYFQNIFIINNAYYTHSIADFYPVLN